MTSNSTNKDAQTPPSNQGGHREKPSDLPLIQTGVDWLTYTCPIVPGKSPEWMAGEYIFPHDGTHITADLLPNPRGYLQCLALRHGRVAWHPERPQQRFMVQFTGAELGALRGMDVKSTYLIGHALNHSARVTRIDFAVDIHGRKANVDEVRSIFEAGHAKTQAGSGGSYRGIALAEAAIRGGETLYIGSPQSDRQMRIYDKGAEQGTNEDWIRVELVSRKELAHNLALAMLTDGEAAAGRQAIRNFFRCAPGLVASRYGGCSR